MENAKRSQFSTAQLVMAAMTVTLLPMLWCMVRGVTKMREHPVLRDTPEMPQVSDLWIAVVMAFGIITVRYVLTKLLEPVSRAILPPHLRDSAFRIDRLATSLFNAFYFSWVSIVGYIILKNEEWFPASLGGSGDFVQAFRVFDIAPSSSVKLYVLLQLAYQIHNLIYVLLLKPLDNDVMDFCGPRRDCHFAYGQLASRQLHCDQCHRRVPQRRK